MLNPNQSIKSQTKSKHGQHCPIIYLNETPTPLSIDGLQSSFANAATVKAGALSPELNFFLGLVNVLESNFASENGHLALDVLNMY